MSALPEGFEGLETWAADWAQPTQNRRWDKRLASTRDEIGAFYHAVSPELERILAYVDRFPMGELPDDAARLYDLAMMLAEVAPNVELYDGEPGVPFSFEERRFIAAHGDETGRELSEALAEQVRWLVAREEIRTVIGRYAQAGDANNDPAVFRTIFCEDAVWEAEGFGRYEGRDEIVRELARIGREQILWSLHFPVSPLIELAAEARDARATWWLWELLTIREDGAETPANKWLGATYDCDFVREADGWKMRHLVLRIQKMVDWPEGAGPPPGAQPPGEAP